MHIIIFLYIVNMTVLLYERYTNNYTKENAMRVKALKINRFAIFYYRLDRKY